MLIGVPKEIKTDEYRVGLTPATVGELTARGHRVAVETMAGAGAGLSDQDTSPPAPRSSQLRIRYISAPN